MNKSEKDTHSPRAYRSLEMHCTNDSPRPHFLCVDNDERPVLCVTNFVNDLSDMPALSPTTIDHYSRKMRIIGETLLNHSRFSEFPFLTLDDIASRLTMADLDTLYVKQQKEGLKAHTVRSTETVARRWTNWLACEAGGRLLECALYDGERAHTPKPSRRIPSYLTIDELIAITNELHFECQRVVMLFGFDTLARASEIERVLKRDIPTMSSFGSSEWQTLKLRGVKGSGGHDKEREVNISRSTVARIHAYHRHPEYIMAPAWSPQNKPAFLNTQGKKWNRSAIGKFISRAARKVELLRDRLPIYPHKALRHTGARHVMNTPDSGTDASDRIDALQSMLGHSDPSTTEIYKNKRAGDAGTSDSSVWRYELSAKLSRETPLPRRKQPNIPEGLKRNGKN